jgi:hypothetical protein
LLGVAAGGVVTAGAAALVPAVRFLHPPSVVPTAAGLVVLGAGLAVLAMTEVRAGWLVVLAGYAWYLPDLALTELAALDGALARTAFLHVGLLVHAVAVARDDSRRAPVAVAVVAGWVAAASAVTGGYRVALPLAGAALVVAVVTTRPRERSSAWRTAAGGALGGGLVVESLLRAAYGLSVEPALVWLHAVAFASAAVLLAIGLTWPSRMIAADDDAIGVERIEPVLAKYLGVPRVSVTVPDREDGWLDVAGRPASPRGHPVRDGEGEMVAMLDSPGVQPAVDEDGLRLLGLVTANARLRRSISQQLDDLTTSRRRLLRSQDVARQAFEARLREGPLARLEGLERAVPVRARAGVARVRDGLAELGRGLDPLTPDGSLVRALTELSLRSPVQLSVSGLVQPDDDAVARAVWFLCSEAVANAAKHAAGSRVTVTMQADAELLVVVVADDGPGGADARGSGLLGAADRIAAAGGQLDVGSTTTGTTLVARLPRTPVEIPAGI